MRWRRGLALGDSAIADLDVRLQPIAQQWLEQCSAAGLKVRITVTWRSATDQNDAKMKGLSNASAGDSPHNTYDANGRPASRAFDFACFMPDGTYISDGNDTAYIQAGQIGKGLDLAWGGDFVTFRDPDHLELKEWRSL